MSTPCATLSRARLQRMPESWDEFVDWAIDFVEQRFTISSPEDEFADDDPCDSVFVSAFKNRYDWARACTEVCVRCVDTRGSRKPWNAMLYPRAETGVGQKHPRWKDSAWRVGRF